MKSSLAIASLKNALMDLGVIDFKVHSIVAVWLLKEGRPAAENLSVYSSRIWNTCNSNGPPIQKETTYLQIYVWK